MALVVHTILRGPHGRPNEPHEKPALTWNTTQNDISNVVFLFKRSQKTALKEICFAVLLSAFLGEIYNLYRARCLSFEQNGCASARRGAFLGV